MKVSTKGRYGLRVMLELAMKHGDGPVMMGAIEKKQGISRKYMHTLLTNLKTAGLVKAVRGAGGGFILAMPPEEIHLNGIVEALEGPFEVTECAGNDVFCNKSDDCVTRQVWREVGEAVKEVLSGITLDQLVARQKAANLQADMFYI